MIEYYRSSAKTRQENSTKLINREVTLGKLIKICEKGWHKNGCTSVYILAKDDLRAIKSAYQTVRSTLVKPIQSGATYIQQSKQSKSIYFNIIYSSQNKMVARVGRESQSRSRKQLRQIWNFLAGEKLPAHAWNHWVWIGTSLHTRSPPGGGEKLWGLYV